MALTNEMLRELLELYVGTSFGEVELERLRPLVERQFQRLAEIQALDVGGDDPRTTRYIDDRRLTP